MSGAMAPRRVCVIGGSPQASSSDTVRAAAATCDVVVAVDRGLDAALAAGIPIDLFCGDADSVSAEGAALVRAECGDGTVPFAVERYNPHKDFTDLSLVLRAVTERWGAPVLVCTCLSGGNPDHLLGVFGRLVSWGRAVELYEDEFIGRVLHAGETWTIEGHALARFSFIPLSSEATVSERGMRWELDRHRVELLSDLGISNVIENDEATIACHSGTIICWTFT